jgi:oxalate decarboxylase/phosphoglucose isomerase-like protein (cupin superfamily)
MFWYGGGYFCNHVHMEDDEEVFILSGIAKYILNQTTHIAVEGDLVIFPRNTTHVNPYNISKSKPLVIVIINPSNALIEFYRYFYSEVEKENLNPYKINLRKLISFNRKFSKAIKFCIKVIIRNQIYKLLHL